MPEKYLRYITYRWTPKNRASSRLFAIECKHERDFNSVQFILESISDITILEFTETVSPEAKVIPYNKGFLEDSFFKGRYETAQ